MKKGVDRQAVVATLVVVALALPFVLAATYLFGKYRWAEGRLAELEPKYARLLGLQASRSELGRAVADTAAMLDRYVYPASQDVSQAGNGAQQRVRDIVTQAGLSIVSSQVLPPKTEGQFDRIPLSLRVEGELSALQAALVVLAGQVPAINFESLTIQILGTAKAETAQRLGVQFNLFVLRAKEGVAPVVVPPASAASQPASAAPAASSMPLPSGVVGMPSAPAPLPPPPAPVAPVPMPAPAQAAPPSPAPPAPSGGPSFGGGPVFGGASVQSPGKAP